MMGDNGVNSEMAQVVIGVNGPLAVGELGVVDAHSHVWIEQVPGAHLEGLILDDVEAITAELRDYHLAGGSAIVDCQPGGCGRNGNQLRRIAQRSGVDIIACSGFHLRRYYAEDARIWQLTAGEAFAYFMDEVQVGLEETRQDEEPVFPGFFKIAAEASLAASPDALFRAVAAACRISGLAIEMHTEKGADAKSFLEFFLTQGVDPRRLVFCHMDKRPDFGLHHELAQAGVLLEYDTFVRPKYEPRQNAWPLLQQMVAAGLGSQVALATDMALTSMWTRLGGGPGPAAFLQEVKTDLEALEMEAEVVQKLMGGNIAARLALAAPSTTRKDHEQQAVYI
jgi:5-phospho-D-xylono-1,4-lactonase